MSNIFHHFKAQYPVQTCRLVLLFLLSSCGGGGDGHPITNDDLTPADDPPVPVDAD